MELSIVKTTKTTTRKMGDWMEKEVLNETGDELRRCKSLDDAIQYVQAYMINDIFIYRENPNNYGFSIMESDDQEWMTNLNRKYVDGFTYQTKSSDPCGYSVTEVYYDIVLLRW